MKLAYFETLWTPQAFCPICIFQNTLSVIIKSYQAKTIDIYRKPAWFGSQKGKASRLTAIFTLLLSASYHIVWFYRYWIQNMEESISARKRKRPTYLTEAFFEGGSDDENKSSKKKVIIHFIHLNFYNFCGTGRSETWMFLVHKHSRNIPTWHERHISRHKVYIFRCSVQTFQKGEASISSEWQGFYKWNVVFWMQR